MNINAPMEENCPQREGVNEDPDDGHASSRNHYNVVVFYRYVAQMSLSGCPSVMRLENILMIFDV